MQDLTATFDNIVQKLSQEDQEGTNEAAVKEGMNDVVQEEIERCRRYDFQTASQAFQTPSPHSDLDSSIRLQAKLSSCLVSSKIEPKSRVFPPNVFQVLKMQKETIKRIF
ncbi:hypothetical protein Tco_1017816 [Tanacetum coccineum]|uniref:Uncharacterized protein n=1 Tax=Tanacetum coccineum TaxID=301880 RepID=A0ABQ5FSK7_9ASTR